MSCNKFMGKYCTQAFIRSTDIISLMSEEEKEFHFNSLIKESQLVENELIKLNPVNALQFDYEKQVETVEFGFKITLLVSIYETFNPYFESIIIPDLNEFLGKRRNN